MKEYSLKKKILIGSCLAVCFAFTVLFYGPVGLYINNSEELSFGLGVVLKNVAILSIIAIACIILFSMIVPSKLFKWYMLLFLGVLLGFYVQGNYINYSYGVLDGTEIEWSKFTRYGILNTAIWAACILIPFIVYFVIRAVNKKKKEDEKTTAAVNKFAIYLAIFIILIQIPALITQVISYKPKNRAEFADDIVDAVLEETLLLFITDDGPLLDLQSGAGAVTVLPVLEEDFHYFGAQRVETHRRFGFTPRPGTPVIDEIRPAALWLLCRRHFRCRRFETAVRRLFRLPWRRRCGRCFFRCPARPQYFVEAELFLSHFRSFPPFTRPNAATISSAIRSISLR